MLRLILAILHLLALGIGLGGLWARARSLESHPFDLNAVRRAFIGDNWWGIAAMLWVVTGLWRLFAGTEKATSYYTHDTAFSAKMSFFLVIALLEIWPMITLIRWRRLIRRRGDSFTPNKAVAAWIRRISYVEVVLLIAMVVAAVSMARGYGYRG